MSISRRTFFAAASTLAVDAAFCQVHQHHPVLPVLPSAAEPYARLQGGQPHHLTADQTAQRSFDSPAPKGPAGRWVPKAALPIPRSEMGHRVGGPSACGGWLWRRACGSGLPPCLQPDHRSVAQRGGIATRCQPRGGGHLGRAHLCFWRVHRAKPQPRRLRLCVRRQPGQVDDRGAHAPSARRSSCRGAGWHASFDWWRICPYG